MANRYDVRNQYESAEFDRNATLVNSITNIVSAGLDITEKVYEYNVQNQQMKAQSDFKDNLSNLGRQLSDLDYDYTQRPISQIDGTYYVGGNPYTPTESDTIHGDVLTTRTRKDALKAYEDKNSFLDGYLAESGLLEGKGSAYKEAYTQLFDDWKASDIQNRTDDLIVMQRRENLSLIESAFTDISSRMGDGSSSERFASELKNLSDGGMKFEIPEVTDEVGSDGYARQTMERDYWTARNLQYYTLRREYTEAEADRMMENTAVSSAMAFDYNSSPDVIDSYIRQNPNLDPTLYVESRLDAFSKSPLLGGRTLTSEEADMYRTSMKTLVSQRMDVFKSEVAQAADSVVSDFSKANADGGFFSYDDIEDALSNAFDGLGTSYGTASGYLDQTTRSNIATLESLALENETARTAYEAAQALNGSEADAIGYATRHGFTTNMGDADVAAAQARRYTWSMLSTEQKAYIHDNVYTTQTEYTFAIPTAKTKEGLPGYVYTLAKENGIQDTDTLDLDEGLAYHTSNMDTTYSNMVELYGDRAWLEAMKDSMESGNLSGDMASYVKVLMGVDGDVGDYFKSVGDKAEELGVDMARPSTIDSAIAYIDARLDSLANSAAESSTFIRNNSTDPTYVSMTKDEFKTKAKGEKSVQEFSNLVGADWSNVNAGLREYLSSEWIGNEASILNYKYTKQADERLLKAMATFGTDDPDTAITKLMRRDEDISTALGGDPYSSRLDSLKENLSARLEENVGGTLTQIYAWEQYGATTSDSPIFRAAVDELYAQCKEKPEKAIDYTEKIKWLKYNTAKDGRYDDVEGQVLKSIQTTGDRIASDAKESLLGFRAVDKTAYDAGVKKADEAMKAAEKSITERKETGIEEAIGKANLMASAGMDVDDIKQTMVFYGMDEEDANKVASTAYASSYGDDGIAKIGGLANIDPVKGSGVEKLANDAVKALVKNMPDEIQTSVSRRYATSLTALLIDESGKGEAADYEKVIADFQNGVVKNQLEMASIGYGIANQEFYSANATDWESGYNAKKLRLDKLPFVQNYADGGYAATLYSQWLDGAPDTDSNRLLATYSADTSLSDDDRQKYSLAFGYNAYTNTETFKAADVADMSYKDVVNRINGLSNDPQKRDVSDVLTLASIQYGAGEALKSLASVAPQYSWLELGRTLGQTGVDGTQLMQSVRFTGDGYVFEVQAANGKPVYCKPTFEDGKVKSDGWTFYRDEKLTDQIYSGVQYGFSGLTDSQLEDIDMTTARYGGAWLTIDVLNRQYAATSALQGEELSRVKAELSQEYTAKLADGTIVTESLSDLRKRRPWDYDFSDIRVNDEVKGMLTRNQRQISLSKSTNGYTSLYAISIADGSFKSSNAKYLYDSSRSGQTIRDDGGNVYTLTADGLSPTLTKTVDGSKERLYWSYATEIASRSNGRVSMDDAYDAVLECYEGFDKPVVYMDSKGVCTTYYPTIYDYIRRGWYL